MIWIRSLCERFGLIASTSETSEPHWPLFSRHLPLATTSPLAAVHLLIILSWPEALNAACAASCQVVAGWLRQRCAPSRLRQPPPVRRFRSFCATRIFGSNDLGMSKISRAVLSLRRRAGLHLSANW